MNIYGILTAAGLLPAYNRAKKRADQAEQELLNYQAYMASLSHRAGEPKQPQEYVNPNKPLDGVTVTPILRVGNLVGKFCSVDGYVVITNTNDDREYQLSQIVVSFTLNNEIIQTYLPIGVLGTGALILRPKEQVQVALSGNTSVILTLDANKRDQLRDEICEVAGKKLITSVKKNTEVSGICQANVEFHYAPISGAGNPIRAAYQYVPCVVRYMGEAFTPNYKNDYEPTVGKQYIEN